MSTETYGAWLASGNILVWITAVDPGLTAVIEQRVASACGAKDHRGTRILLSAGLLITIVIALGVLGIGLALSPIVPSLIQLSASVDPFLIESAFRIAVIGSSLLIFSYGLSGMSRGLQGTFESGVATVLNKLLSIAVVVYLLYDGFGLMALPWGKVVGGSVLTVGNASYIAWRMIDDERIALTTVSGHKIWRLAKLMGYNFFGRAGNIIANNVDSFIIGRYIGSDVVPMYRLTKKAPDLAEMFINRITVSFIPATSHIAGEGRTDRARAVLLRLLRFIMWSLALSLGGMVALNDDFVRLWVGPELFGGNLLNGLICGLLLILILTKGLSNLCYALGNIKGNSVASGIQSILYVGAAWIGAVYGDLVGLVVAVMLSNGLVALWYYPFVFAKLLSISKEDVQSLLVEVAKTVTVTAVVVGAFSFVVPNGWMQFVATAAAFAVVQGLGLTVVSAHLRSELRKALQRVAATFRSV
jgi:O-antigen/teichoic acid export membrane protein